MKYVNISNIPYWKLFELLQEARIKSIDNKLDELLKLIKELEEDEPEDKQ